ncbi:hypothetical protein EB796_019341 [Bugula neritina]|uniref:Uncharacterized protein n=1 Tax=Bugula neritina TaxID=10212 RepID=A0A7J7J8G7_BUGNE|nr:hypothetical protein EB796_019341 [Bugula neritina]
MTITELKLVGFFVRVNGHEKDSIQTYGMVTGLLNGGLGLGAMVGPIMSGAVTDTTDYTWTLTILSGIGLAMARVLQYESPIMYCNMMINLLDIIYREFSSNQPFEACKTFDRASAILCGFQMSEPYTYISIHISVDSFYNFIQCHCLNKESIIVLAIIVRQFLNI